MAQKTVTQLLSEISSQFPDNISGAITPAILRSVTSDMVNSAPVLAGNIPGAAGNGSTDDSAAINSAISAQAVLGGGVVYLGPFVYYCASTIIMQPDVYLVGNLSAGGVRTNNDYTGLPYSIKSSAVVAIQMDKNSGLSGIAIVQNGLTVPTTVQQCLTALAAWTGTAIGTNPARQTAGNNTSDVLLQNLFIIGFATGINLNWADRFRVYDVYGDCQAGMVINQSNDVGRVYSVEWWPFFNQNNENFVAVPQWAVSTVANNGSGLFRVTTTTNHGLVTGNQPFISGVVGNPVNLRWTVTVINSTQFDLQASTFSGAYTSGGTVTLNSSRRSGIGFNITNSADVTFFACFGASFDGSSFYCGLNTVWIEFHGCIVDALSLTYDLQYTGVIFDSNSDRCKWIGGYVSSYGTSFQINSTVARSHQIIGCAIGATNVYAASVNQGSVTFTACDFTGGLPIYLADAATYVQIIGCESGGTTFSYQSLADVQKGTVVGGNGWQINTYVYPGSIRVAFGNGIDFNSVADTAVSFALPPQAVGYVVNMLVISGASGTLTTAKFGLFSAASAGGTALLAGGTAITVSTATVNAANSAQVVAGSATVYYNFTTLYFRVTTPQGSAATANVILDITPVY